MANTLMPQQSGTALSPDNAGAGAGEQKATYSPSTPQMVATFLQGNRRLVILAAALLTLAGFISLFIWSTKPPYQPLYAGMSEADASQVVNFLEKEHIPYRLEGRGTVTVPSDKIYSARLKLAGKSIVPGKGMGFELFDKKDTFGLSDFTRQVNYQRALQGELARTIQVLPIVEAARVHLVMPKASAFVDRERKASASIMLKLVGNQRLPRKTISAIQNLVAGSVPELDRGAVTIVDSAGNLLSIEDGPGQNRNLSNVQNLQEYQTSLEQRMEVRLTSMLEQIVGSGQAVVRVSTSIDRDQLEQDSQIYNPDEAVLRSEKTVSESRSATTEDAKGVPGIASNKPSPKKSAEKSVSPSENATHNERTANYEISRKTEHRVVPFGTVKKISVAAIVGGSFKDVNGTKTFVPREAKEITALKALVERAIGYNEDRGDIIEIQSLPLVSIAADVDAGAMERSEKQAFYLQIARYALAVLALILVVWFLLRPLSKGLMALGKPTPIKPADDAVGGGSSTLTLQDNRHLSSIDKVNYIISKEPERAATVIKEWVNEPS